MRVGRPGRRKKPHAPPRLYVYGVTVESWTRKYGVQPFSHPCAGCGTILTTSIPFAQGTLRGLEAPECVNGCHNEASRPPYALVRDPKHGDLFDGDLNS